MKKIKRRICVVVTARPSYSRIKTALTAIQDHPELELLLVIAGSALLDRYGNAVDFIEKDGFKVTAKVFMVLEGENPTTMAKTTGIGVMELTNVFYNLKPDAVVTIADRFETIATSIAAAYQNIPLIHIQGGEVTGSIDEKVRHANTKLADLHLVSSEDAKERVIRLGENPEKVINTGCPSIDLAKQINSETKLNFNPIDGTSNGIRAFREIEKPENIHFFKNMEPLDFLRLIKYSKALVGNSSTGIRECAYLGIPVINIGSRQNRRLRAKNVFDVSCSSNEIILAIKKAISNGFYSSSEIYGNGSAGEQIAEILATEKLEFSKTITY